jgi:hypothetical protein
MGKGVSSQYKWTVKRHYFSTDFWCSFVSQTDSAKLLCANVLMK